MVLKLGAWCALVAAHAAAAVTPGIVSLLADPMLLQGRVVGVIGNPTSVLPDLSHEVDALLHASRYGNGNFEVRAVFGPEHGFRGAHQAGHGGADSYNDTRTGLPVYSAYGKNHSELTRLVRKSGVDTLIFDIQDVGVRFYTFIWTMWDMMQAAAAATTVNGSDPIRFIVLDRPNPLGGTSASVAGPVLNPNFASGVGWLPIPLSHGMTVGELAQLFNSEFLHLPKWGVKS